MTKEIYKRYRPRTLDEVVGNRATVAALRSMIAKGRLPHTILLSGPSGSGKTTLARIIRRELGAAQADCQEVNVANFRGIDSVRQISQTMGLAPIGGKARVYILDECHAWSRDAQNAALKILEDTPPHVWFLLCTTDPEKLIPTILTRCARLPVAWLSEEEAEGLVRRTAKAEGISLSKGTVEAIVAAAGGSARAALVALDKVANLDEADREEALKQAQEANAEAIQLCRALIDKEPWGKVARILRGIKDDPEQVRWAVLGYARSVLLGGGPKAAQAYNVISSFSNNFFDSKTAGLAGSAFEATCAE